MRRAKLLAHDWSSGRLATAHSIETFSVTMASSFETVDGEIIQELKDKGENENTKNSTEW